MRANLLYGMLTIAVVFFAIAPFFGLADWLGSFGIPKLLAIGVPLLVSGFGAIVLKYQRPKWFGISDE